MVQWMTGSCVDTFSKNSAAAFLSSLLGKNRDLADGPSLRLLLREIERQFRRPISLRLEATILPEAIALIGPLMSALLVPRGEHVQSLLCKAPVENVRGMLTAYVQQVMVQMEVPLEPTIACITKRLVAFDMLKLVLHGSANGTFFGFRHKFSIHDEFIRWRSMKLEVANLYRWFFTTLSRNSSNAMASIVFSLLSLSTLPVIELRY